MVADAFGTGAVLVAGSEITGFDHRALEAGEPLHLTEVVVGEAVGAADGADGRLAGGGTHALADALLGGLALLVGRTAEQAAWVYP